MQISTAPDFGVLSGERVVKATPDSDFEVCVLVVGLRPGTDYFYRFRAEGDTSPIIGRIRTVGFLDADEVENLMTAAAG